MRMQRSSPKYDGFCPSSILMHVSETLRARGLHARPSHARQVAVGAGGSGKTVTLLDYGAGNVRSVRNAITKLGYTIKDVRHPAQLPSACRLTCQPTRLQVERPADILSADRLIFPGVGAFGQAMKILKERGWTAPLKEYLQVARNICMPDPACRSMHGARNPPWPMPPLQADKPFLGICLGLQLLFDGSEESGGQEGLGIIPGLVAEFDTSRGLPVPHIGWNDLQQTRPSTLLSAVGDQRVYFVHSYRCAQGGELVRKDMRERVQKGWQSRTSGWSQQMELGNHAYVSPTVA